MKSSVKLVFALTSVVVVVPLLCCGPDERAPVAVCQPLAGRCVSGILQQCAPDGSRWLSVIECKTTRWPICSQEPIDCGGESACCTDTLTR